MFGSKSEYRSIASRISHEAKHSTPLVVADGYDVYATMAGQFSDCQCIRVFSC